MKIYKKKQLTYDEIVDELSSLYSIASNFVVEDIANLAYKNGKELTVVNVSVRVKDLFALKNKLNSLEFDDT